MQCLLVKLTGQWSKKKRKENRSGGRKVGREGRKEGRKGKKKGEGGSERGRGKENWREGKGIYLRSWRILTDNVGMDALVNFIINCCGF